MARYIFVSVYDDDRAVNIGCQGTCSPPKQTPGYVRGVPMVAYKPVRVELAAEVTVMVVSGRPGAAAAAALNDDNDHDDDDYEDDDAHYQENDEAAASFLRSPAHSNGTRSRGNCIHRNRRSSRGPKTPKPQNPKTPIQ